MKIKWLLCVGLQILMRAAAGLQIQPNWYFVDKKLIYYQ